MFPRFVVALVVFTALAANAADTASEKLPVRRVVLYKNGVGYFEHMGRVQGAQELKIDFTSAQLNDVLKSLTVLDLNGGKIAGVGYNSVAPIAQQLKTLRLPLGESTTLAGFLNALRGTRVDVRNGSMAASGRLLSVEEKSIRAGKDEVSKTLELSLVTAAGEVRSFPLTSSLAVRVADHDLGEEINKYLILVSSARDQDIRQMSIVTTGSGERRIFVSYISEVPVWKSTYRILLPTKTDATPLLQGWAIVDNTVGEDWKDVQLSLVAGAPQSFIQELSKPLYTRRPVMELPETAMLTPQTHEGTLTDVLNGPLANAKPAPPSPTPPSPGVAGGVIGGVPGGGSAGRIGNANGGAFTKRMKSGANEVAGTTEVEEEETAANQLQPVAYGEDLGDLFEYNLKEKVTILKNHSALVPIINSPINVEKVTLWNKDSEHPLRALWITNSSGLTLDGGTFNVIEDNAFAGEGLIEPLKPQEKRLLSYAVDQAVRIDVKDDVEARPVTHIKIAKGVMIQTTERQDHQVYTLRNTDTEPREVVIEHPVRNGWKLSDGLKPEETTASYYRFRVKAAPGSSAQLKVDEVEPLQRKIALSSVTDEQIKIWFNDRVIKPDLEEALKKIVQKKGEISGFEHDIQFRQAMINGINQDQQRLRENMKALKGSAEERALLQRYTRELNEQEDKLDAVRGEISKLEVRREEGRQQLDRLLEDLTLDEAI
jgi:hypothetical protein